MTLKNEKKEIDGKEVLWEKVKIEAVDLVEEYWETYKKAVRISILGRRLGSRLSPLKITTVSLFKLLQREKKVKMLMALNLSRHVIPYLAWQKLTKKEREDFLKKLSPVDAKKKINEIDEEGDGVLPVDDFF